jgi:hypothetical protein
MTLEPDSSHSTTCRAVLGALFKTACTHSGVFSVHTDVDLRPLSYTIRGSE